MKEQLVLGKASFLVYAIHLQSWFCKPGKGRGQLRKMMVVLNLITLEIF